ncbi:hypothetical protein N7539_009311 [Penicillium diatomitis]|uniref:Uncharacterized protein n=1 Tax=Penicillium diatomitis TaxID=2819901 RepID=A0A9W9WLK3_9EURO|nr:uncharacterized protein N7539_009311 [Penicillium diatomitis]KAJ5469693.1 hypothetical protein N7539_009311 [Penicillium diatomitis]
MDCGDQYSPGELDALYADWNRSETTICLPSPSPLTRGSTYLPKEGSRVLEEAVRDPFYLEQSLEATPSWNSVDHSVCDDILTEYEHEDCITLPQTIDSFNPRKSAGQNNRPDRSTIAQLEFENNRRFHRYTSSTEDTPRVLHSSQESFSSVNTDTATPDLTPSSSFSSAYSSAPCPEAVLKATEKLYQHAHRAQPAPCRAFYLPASTPPQQLPLAPPVPAIPRNYTRPETPLVEPSPSSFTLAMKYESPSMSSSSHRRKAPPPSLSNLGRRPSSHGSRKKQPSPGTRTPLDPSMISPPSLINPVTMEPHATHFEQALFIPANDCPSPIPSPSASSPPISRQWTATSTERPSTSTTADAFCEHSVWESDSDNDSIGHKSLSRKPIDTLRKVRSRAKLRAAKSHPRLGQRPSLDDAALEKFPCVTDDILGPLVPEPSPGGSLHRPSTSRDGFRPPHPLQTLRLVAPSSTSLLNPRSRNNSHGQLRESDMDRSTAAAVQAQSRRRQQSDSSGCIHEESDKLTSMCYEQHAPLPFEEPMDNRPFFKRMIDSLRSLSCHKTAPKTPTPTP